LKVLKKFDPWQIREHWFEITLILIVLGVHLYAAFSAPHNFPVRWFTRDDAYYYFKVAQNISEGHGPTFDGLNLTNGYHPLWMLVCIPIFSLARFDLILPLRLLIVVMAALSATSSILLFRLLKKAVGEPIAMLAAAFWAFSLVVHDIITQQGMETGIVALSTLFLLYQLQKTEGKDQLSTTDLAALALASIFMIFSRLDGIFLALMAGIWIIFRRHPLRYLLPLDLLMTFFVVVGIYLQRAGLKRYLLSYANSAFLVAALIFVIQVIVFYFIGLYQRPKALTALRLALLTLAGVTLSALLSAGAMLILAALGLIDLPRSIPLFTGLGILAVTLLTRFTLRLISPWPTSLDEKPGPNSGIFPSRAQLQRALEPLPAWLRSGGIYYGLLGIALALYMGFNRLLFGTFMPVSGQIKHWWGSIPNDVYGGSSKTILDVFNLDPAYSQPWGLFQNPLYDRAWYLAQEAWNIDGWYWAMAAVLLSVWLIFFLCNRRRNLRRIYLVGLIPLLLGAEFQAFYYSATTYSAKHEWYWVSQMLTLVILAALGLGAGLDLFPRHRVVQIGAWALAGTASLYLAYTFSFELVSRMPYQDALAGQPYMDMLPILEGYTEPGALIGMTGGGNAGYYIQGRTIVNMDGLINSYPYFQALQANHGGDYLAEKGLTYVFANQYILTNSMPYRQQFTPEEFSPVAGAPVYGQKELMHFKILR